ncbi:hypothetical protein ACI77I_31340 [Pseudomonas sp. D47]|uniref:hypothetical protein n=1 Tax=Pseudomonas sp. D47 TaxID=3159447 RepID=UPI00387B195B
MPIIQSIPASLPLTNPAILPATQATNTQVTEVAANDIGPDELDNPLALKKAFADRCNWNELATKHRCSVRPRRRRWAAPYKPNWAA